MMDYLFHAGLYGSTPVALEEQEINLHTSKKAKCALENNQLYN